MTPLMLCCVRTGKPHRKEDEQKKVYVFMKDDAKGSKAMNIVITSPVLPLIIHGNLLRIKNVFLQWTVKSVWCGVE